MKHEIEIGKEKWSKSEVSFYSPYDKKIHLLEKELIEIHKHGKNGKRTIIEKGIPLTEVIETIISHEYLHSILDYFLGSKISRALDNIHQWKRARYKRLTFEIRQRSKISKLSYELNKKLGSRKEIFRTTRIKDFEFLGNGLSRICFLHKSGKYVLKFERERDRTKYRQNEHEIKNYENIPKKLRKYFTRPLAYANDYSWILMEKVKTESDLSYAKIGEIVEELDKILRMNNIFVEDIHSTNVGQRGNQSVVIDYGWNLIGKEE